MASGGKRVNGFPGFLPASSSPSFSRAGNKEKGIRIYDVISSLPEIPRRPSGFYLGVDDHGDDVSVVAAPPASPLARARGCDVYVGYGGGASVERFVAWLCAEMEALGVRCVAEDRRRCRDAPSHAAARAAMDAAAAGVVVAVPASLGNPYCLDEIRAFADTGRLVPVLVGLGKGDLLADEVTEREGQIWGRFGGHLWKVFDGGEKEWRSAVESLRRADPAVEVDAAGGDQRLRVVDVVEIVGKRLGRRAVADAVRSWRAAAATQPEIPLPRNENFVGREDELADLEAVLFGEKRVVSLVEVEEVPGGEAFMDGVVCIAGESGAGKTELALEYAHRHAMEYKRVLWVHGEARYLRLVYLKLADHLGLAVGDDLSHVAAVDRNGSNSISDGWVFRGIEAEAIAKIRKELTREIPYLLVIDNLESETDWWDSRDFHDLLPFAAGGGGRCHVIITTSRLRRVRMVRTFSLPEMGEMEATLLMTKGNIDFSFSGGGGAAMAAIRAIGEKVRGVPLALALVGDLVAGGVAPVELRRAMNGAPYRSPTWEESDEPALRDNPGLVHLLDACFELLDGEKDGLAAAALTMAESSGFFAPSPIPVPLLAAMAATGGERKTKIWKQMKRALRLSCVAASAATAAEPEPEPEPLATLLRLGIARRSSPSLTSPPCVTVHRVFALFARKVAVGSSDAVAEAARRAVRAIAAVDTDDEHAWAACMSVFNFTPAVPAHLPSSELPQFVTRVAVPLAEHGVAAYSAYAVAGDLLVEASDAVRGEEDRLVARGLDAASASVYHELAWSRAELLKLRARLMLRGGEFALAENHILSAVNILEVVAGEDHPETEAARAVLDRILLAQPSEE